MPFFPGLVAGFTGALDEGRARNVEEQGRINARENQILSLLASSDDDEVKALAISTMLDLAGPKPKGKGLAGFLKEAQGSPQFAAVQRFVNSTRTETQQVPDVESQPAASLTSNFQRSAQAGGAAQPEAQPLAEAPPGDIQQILAAGGLPDTQLDIGGGLEGALGTPPPVPTTGRDVQVPRTLFKSEAEKATDQQTAQFDAFKTQLEALGVLSPREIGEVMANQPTLFRDFASGGTGFQQGRFAVLPSGQIVRTTFDRASGLDLYQDPENPGNLIPVPVGTDFTSAAALSFGDQVEVESRRMFDRPFTSLEQHEAAQVQDAANARVRGERVGTARDVARVTGDEAIITAQGMPLSPTALAMFPDATSLDTLETLAGKIPLTNVQRNRLFAAGQVDVLIDNIAELLPRVFPDVEPGFIGLMQTQFSLAQQMLGADEDLAALDAAVETALGQVATLGGDSGRLAVDDINRARASLADVKAKFLGGDTLATARARIDVVRDLLTKVREQTPTERAAPAPIETTGDLGTPPPTDPNVVDASTLRPAPQ